MLLGVDEIEAETPEAVFLTEVEKGVLAGDLVVLEALLFRFLALELAGLVELLLQVFHRDELVGAIEPLCVLLALVLAFAKLLPKAL